MNIEIEAYEFKMGIYIAALYESQVVYIIFVSLPTGRSLSYDIHRVVCPLN